jgi:SAM-dependent methyltransferase
MSQATSALPIDRKQAFQTLHDERLLGAHESISGAGSSLMATHGLRKALTALLESGHIKSILDIGCGDFHWLSVMDLKDITYTGTDIVPELIENNRARWANSTRHFEVADIVEAVPPQRDLVLCKDVLGHFPLADIATAFNHIKQSGARYFAATNIYPQLVKQSQQQYYKDNTNIDISPAYWRPLALCDAPFHLRIPLWSIPLNHNGKTLDIWALEDLPYLDMQAVLHPTWHSPIQKEDFYGYRFLQELAALPFIQRVGLYGSRMLKKASADSDIDLLIYCKSPPTQQQWLQVCNVIDHADTPLEIDCKLYCPELPTLLDNPEVYKYHIDHMITLYPRTDDA